LSSQVELRNVFESDLPIFFAHQLDPEANQMAAFTAKDPSDNAYFRQHWSRILSDETVTNRTVLYDGKVAGYVASYTDQEFGKPEVTYWIGKEYWGKGIATRALSRFLEIVKVRPIYARVAKDNLGSIRVLLKCGFVLAGDGKGFANARGEEIEEHVMKLE